MKSQFFLLNEFQKHRKLIKSPLQPVNCINHKSRQLTLPFNVINGFVKLSPFAVKRTFNKGIRDIEERNKIKNNDELEELINVIASGIGCLTNPQKLASTFNSVKHIDISLPTIKQYLDYLQDSFIINKVLRYDIKGKKYISTPSKYYFTDIGLRNARLNFRQQEETHIMENIIYNELNIRGYEVDVGEIGILEKNATGYTEKKVEVDFVASKGSKKYYIQSAFMMPTEEKKIQEERDYQRLIRRSTITF